MSLIASGAGEFEIPPEGMYQGVCVDVVDLGNVETGYKDKNDKPKIQHKCRVVWELNLPMADGRNYIVSRRFTVVLSENSALRPFLETWRGKTFTTEELVRYDLENLLGANGYLQILYHQDGDKTYANVNTVMPWMSNYGPLMTPSGSYTRVQDRDGYEPPNTQKPALAQQPAPPRMPLPPSAQTQRAQTAQATRTPSMPPPAMPGVPQTITDDDIPF